MHLTSRLRELREPGTALASAVELRVLSEQVQDLAVRRARDQGWSWAQIAAALGTPRKQLRATHNRDRAGHG